MRWALVMALALVGCGAPTAPDCVTYHFTLTEESAALDMAEAFTDTTVVGIEADSVTACEP